MQDLFLHLNSKVCTDCLKVFSLSIQVISGKNPNFWVTSDPSTNKSFIYSTMSYGGENYLRTIHVYRWKQLDTFRYWNF